MEYRQDLFKEPELDLVDMGIAIGIVAPLPSPYNLYLNMKQILDPHSEEVYFYVVTYGEKRIVMWGRYFKDTEEFEISGGCKYSVEDLNKLTKTYKRRDYSYIGNSITNERILEAQVRYGMRARSWGYDEYLRYKFILAFYEELISENELQQQYPDEPYAFENEVYEYHKLDILRDDVSELERALKQEIHLLKEKIRKYESDINRMDLDWRILSSVTRETRDYIKYVTGLFYDVIKFGYYTEGKYYDNLDSCPSVEECVENYDVKGCEVVYYGDELEMLR